MNQKTNRWRWLQRSLAIVLLAIGNIAGAQTVNLNDHRANTSLTYEWYKVTATSPSYTYSAALTGTDITAAGPGLYAANVAISSPTGCKQYSYIRVATNDCPSTTVDLSKYVGTAPSGASFVYFKDDAPTTELTSSVVSSSGTYLVAYKYSSPTSPSTCYSDKVPIVVAIKLCTDPDFNSTLVNIPVNGNVATNDGVTGASYGTPVLKDGPAGATGANAPVITMSSTGSYTFTASVPGTYKYDVPVCSGTPQVCVNETLTITVEPTTPSTINPAIPVANPDWATINSWDGTGTAPSVSVPVKANDAAMTPGTTLTVTPQGTSSSQVSLPGQGTYYTDPTTGNIVFTPAAGFSGEVKIPYQVCEYIGTTNTNNCVTSYAVIDVAPAGAPNSTVAVDDYATTSYNTPVTVDIKANDSDPQAGQTQTVQPFPANANGPISSTNPVVIPNVGSYYLDASGKLVFTPAPGYVGPVDIKYTTCDNGSPQACADATAHILVKSDFNTDPDFNSTLVNVPVSGNVSTNDGVAGAKYPVYTTTTLPTPTTTVSGSNPVLTMDATGAYTFKSDKAGTYVYTVPVCVGTAPNTVCKDETLTFTVEPTTVTSTTPATPVANPDWATTPSGTAVTVPVLLNDAAMTPGTTIKVTQQGTTDGATQVSVTGGTYYTDANGKIVFTPTAGFYGEVKIPYEVCEYVGSTNTSRCVTTYTIIDVAPPSAPTTTVAVDDYKSISINTPVTTTAATGVLANDGTTGKLADGTTPATLSVTGFGDLSAPTAAGGTYPIPGKGTIKINADGSYTFTPVDGYVGPVDVPYRVCNDATPQTCDKATLHILVKPDFNTDPDMNTTFVGVPVPGNVSTNDGVPGATYGTPVPSSGNPTGGTITMQPNGSYVFTGTTPGVYNYTVPVCVGLDPNKVCTNETLSITVEPLVPTTSTPLTPVANPEAVTVPYNAGGATTYTPLPINILANDVAMTPGTTPKVTPLGTSSSPLSITGGTYYTDASGKLIFTPTPGFYGEVTIPYTVCETPDGTNCKATNVVITVPAPTALNSTQAADDYAATTAGSTVTVNVQANDTDAEGNTQTVTPMGSSTSPIVIPGKGSYYTDASGQIVFTALPDYAGPVDIPYTITDNGTEQATAKATLHITVKPAPFNPTPDVNVGYVGVPVKGSVASNDNLPTLPSGSTYGYGTSPTPASGNPSGGTLTMDPSGNGTYTFTGTTPGVYVYTVPVCVQPAGTPCVNETLTITINPENNTYAPVANVDIATVPANTGVGTAPSVTLNTLANDAPAGGTTLNAGSVKIKNPVTGVFEQPTASTPMVIDGVGTLSVDALGNITFTPAPGYTGTYTYTYEVCDNQATPKCTQAKQEVTVAPTTTNVLSAADDYKNVIRNTPVTVDATKGVLANDVNADATSGQTMVVTATPAGGTTLYGPDGTTVAGTLELNSNGGYTFTPATGFTGTTNYVYQVCENPAGTPAVCKNATLYITVNYTSGALPVNLISFSGVAEECHVNLSWVSGSETNFAGYLVESSTNGGSFTKAGYVSALGSNNRYQFVDYNAAKGTNFYRLKMIDIDGKFIYSSIIKVQQVCGSKITVTPTLTNATIDVRGLQGNESISLINAIGQVVKKVNTKNTIERIDLSRFANGMYHVSVVSADGTIQTFKVVKY